jgi:hypothetical protein
MDINIELALLKERYENLDLQMKRFAAHLESEQRVYGETSKRVGDLSTWVDRMQKHIDKLDIIVINSGNGLGIRVDRIEQKSKQNHNNLYKWISILSFLTSVGLGVLTIINKT